MIADRGFLLNWLEQLKAQWLHMATAGSSSEQASAMRTNATHAESAIALMRADGLRISAPAVPTMTSPVKFFEIRDRGTFIPVIAIRLTAERGTQDDWLLQRGGFAEWQLRPECQTPYVVVWRLEGGEGNYDPFNWPNRTMAGAHQHILAQWASLNSGDVIDTEYLRGERLEPKQSERVTNG